MAKTPEVDADTSEAKAAEQPAVSTATAPVEFYAKDRWMAQTHVRAVWNVPHDVAERVRDALEKMAHTGPVRVVVHPDLSDNFGAELPSSVVPGDGFAIMPFTFVKV